MEEVIVERGIEQCVGDQAELPVELWVRVQGDDLGWGDYS